MNDFLLNEEPALRAITFLQALKRRAIETRSSLLSSLNPNDIKLLPSELYVHAEISGGGTQHLLTGEIAKVPGVTNFNGNRLSKERFFVANGITVAYGEEEKFLAFLIVVILGVGSFQNITKAETTSFMKENLLSGEDLVIKESESNQSLEVEESVEEHSTQTEVNSSEEKLEEETWTIVK